MAKRAQPTGKPSSPAEAQVKQQAAHLSAGVLKDHADNRLFLSGGVSDPALPHWQSSLEPLHASVTLSPLQGRMAQPGGADASFNRGTVSVGDTLGTQHLGLYQNIGVTGANLDGQVLRFSDAASLRLGVDVAAAPSLGALGGFGRLLLSPTQAIGAGGGAFALAGQQLRVQADARVGEDDATVRVAMRKYLSYGVGFDPSVLMAALLGLGLKFAGATSRNVSYHGPLPQTVAGAMLRRQQGGPWTHLQMYLRGLGLLPTAMPLPDRQDPLARSGDAPELPQTATLVYEDARAHTVGVGLGLGPLRGLTVGTSAHGSEFSIRRTGPSELVVSLQRQIATGLSVASDLPVLAEVHGSRSHVVVRRESFRLDMRQPAARQVFTALASPQASLGLDLADPLEDPSASADTWRRSRAQAPAGVEPLYLEQSIRPTLASGAGALRLPFLPQQSSRGAAHQRTLLTERLLRVDASASTWSVSQASEPTSLSVVRGGRRTLHSFILQSERVADGTPKADQLILHSHFQLDKPDPGAQRQLLRELAELTRSRLGTFDVTGRPTTYSVDVKLALRADSLQRLTQAIAAGTSVSELLLALGSAASLAQASETLRDLQHRTSTPLIGQVAHDMTLLLGPTAAKLEFSVNSDLYTAPLEQVQNFIAQHAGLSAAQRTAVAQRHHAYRLLLQLRSSAYQLRKDPLAKSLTPAWHKRQLAALAGAQRQVLQASQRIKPSDPAAAPSV